MVQDQRFVRTPRAYYERHTVFPFYPRPQQGGLHELEVVVYSDANNFKVLDSFETHADADAFWLALTKRLNIIDIDIIDDFRQ